jgi:hypothetical protein
VHFCLQYPAAKQTAHRTSLAASHSVSSYLLIGISEDCSRGRPAEPAESAHNEASSHQIPSDMRRGAPPLPGLCASVNELLCEIGASKKLVKNRPRHQIAEDRHCGIDHDGGPHM